MHIRQLRDALAPSQLVRRLWSAGPARKTTATLAALAVLASLAVGLMVHPKHGAAAPAQQLWGSGTAAGMPHRVPASQTRALPVLTAGRHGTGVAASRGGTTGTGGATGPRLPARRTPRSGAPRGAVPRASRPHPVKLPARGHAAESLRQEASPAVPPVTGFNPRTSRPLPASRTANRTVYQNTDGTKTAFVYQDPVSWRRPGGSWASIDNRLAAASPSGRPAPPRVPPTDLISPSPSPGLPSRSAAPSSPAAPASPPPAVSSAAGAAAGWVERSAAEPVRFAPYADAARLVWLPLAGSRGVGFGLAAAPHVAGQASGPTVTYAGAGPDADLRFTAGTGQVKEQIVLRSAAAPQTWVFPLDLRGLRAVAGPNGTIAFVTAAGAVAAAVPPGFMTDSNVSPGSGDGAGSTGVSYSLVSVDGHQAIKMTLDSAWLHAPARVFPVTVDPSVRSTKANGTTYVTSPGSGDNSGGTEIKAGTWDGGSDIAKSFLKFDSVSSSLQNDTVLGAELGLFNSWSYSCSPRPVYVYPVTSSWSVTGSKSWPGPSTGAAVGRATFASGWVPLGSTTSPCPSKWQNIALDQAATNLINGWTHGSSANNGLAVGASASDSFGWKKFTSDNVTNGAPVLAVTYTPDGASYKLASTHPVIPVEFNSNGELAIRVTNTGSSTWTPTNGYELSYTAFGSNGKQVGSAHPVFTPMPSNVGPGQSVVVDAKVNQLPVGSYSLNFTMYSAATGSSPVSFTSQHIPGLAVGLYVPQPPPVVTNVYPPTGYISPTDTPQLAVTATSLTGTSITYDFTLTCTPLPGQTCPAISPSSGNISKPYWTAPALQWNTPYRWTVKATNGTTSTTVGPVTITPEVPQPDVTSHLGGSSAQAFDPQTGDFATSATDAAVTVPGPALSVARTYNSLNPDSGEAFGMGWSSVADMAVTPDSDGSNNVVVTMPDGSQQRYGCNSSGTSCVSPYSAPMGSPDALVRGTDSTWSLVDTTGTRYDFTSAGQISKITDADGLAQTFAYTSGEITTITDSASGRALHLTWSTPSGATTAHVASVTTGPPAAGQSGMTWAYTYSGDELTQVCAPTGGCTSYSYAATGSHYPTAVMDSAPRSYYRLGDPPGSAKASDSVDTNLGTTDGTYSNVTLGGAGPLAGGATSAAFNGTSSSVTVAPRLISDSTNVTVELWFKTASSTAGGVLFAYQADPLSSSTGNSDHHVPALYVGGDGKLYGELWNGKVDPMVSAGIVADGHWHHVVLTGSGNSQSLWLDGVKAGSVAGQIDQLNMNDDFIGAGFWQDGWPAATQNSTATPVGYFSGSIAEVAVYPHALGQPAIAGHDALGTAAASELTQVTMPSGRVSQQVSYDTTADRVSGYTDPHGGQWVIHLPITSGFMPNPESLSQASRSVSVVDPAGYQEVYTYDALNGGRLVSYDRGNGDAPRAFCYDGAGFLSAVTDEDGDTVSFTNDIHGNVLSRTWYPTQPASTGGCGGSTAPTGSGSTCTATGAACTAWYSYFYNAANPLDPRNDELTAVRDARSASSTDNTYLTSYAYNAAGQLTSSTTPATSDFPSGRSTSYTYSNGSQAAFGGTGTVPAGLLLTTTTPGGAVTSNAYAANGDLAQVTEPSGRQTTYTYDLLGRPLTSTVSTSTNPGGLTTSYTYNSLGQPLSVTHPPVADAVTSTIHTLQDSYSYDSDGDLTTLTQADTTGHDPSRTTSYTYDDHGQVATVTQPAGATSGGGSQSQGSSSANPGGATTGYTYDSSGNITQVVDPNGTTYRYSYNEYHNVTQVTLYTPASDPASPVASCAAPASPDPDGGCDLVIQSDSYDPAGLLAARTDAIGRITNYHYFFDQSLAQVEQQPATGQGKLASYGYDPAGNLASQSITALSNGAATGPLSVTAYTHDAANRLTRQVADPVPAGSSASGYVNRTTNYTYNADGYLTSQTQTDGSASQTTSYGYDTAGDKTSQTVHNGTANLVTTWAYDQNGQPVSMTDPRGNATGASPASYTTNYTYDAAGDLATVTGPPQPVQTFSAQSPVTTRPVTSYGYDTFGDQTQSVDPDQNRTTKTYDGDGRVLTVTQPAYTPPGAASPVTATTTNAYDEAGHLASVTDPAGNTTSYAYDAAGDLISQTDPKVTGQTAPGVTTYTYDAAGERLSATDPAGAATSYTYDYFGDQLTATDALNQTTSSTYDDLGDPTQVTSPAGVVTKLAYDHVGDLTSTTDAAGDTTSYGYNYLGQLSQLTRPDQTAETYGYDGAGDLTSVTDYGTAPVPQTPPVLRTQTLAYDGAGNVTGATDGNGNTTSYTYTAASRLASQVQPVTGSASVTTTYGYDAAGNRTSVTDPDGNTTWTTYNSRDLPESVIEPSTAAYPAAGSRTWTTAYDADGRPVTVTEPGGVTVTDGYDQLGDLTSQTGTGASAATPARSFGYDTDGRMVSASAPGGTDAFAYNADGQLTSVTGPSGSSSFGYNPDGRLTSETGPAGTTGYTYDSSGRLSTLADPVTGATATYTYTPDSQVSQIAYGTGNDIRSFHYDQLGQLTADALKTGGGATAASISYGYDGSGNLTSKTTSGFAGAAANTYTYDKAGRLTSWNNGTSTTGYSYDAAGNVTQAGNTVNAYNARDQLTSSTTGSAAVTFGYTPSGTLSTQTSGSATVSTTTNAFGLPATQGGQSFSYDALGRMTGDSGPAGSFTLAYLGASGQVTADGKSDYSYSPAGQLTGMGTQGGGTSQGQLAYTDQHTDVVGGFAPAGGSLAASASYDPWGTVTAAGGGRAALGYQSGFTDPGSGQVRMGARWYQPSMGTFTTGDTTSAGMPMAASISPNPYGYASGNPVTATDPTGHNTCYVSAGFFEVPVQCPAPRQTGGIGIGWGGSSGSLGTGWGFGAFQQQAPSQWWGAASQSWAAAMYEASLAMSRIYAELQSQRQSGGAIGGSYYGVGYSGGGSYGGYSGGGSYGVGFVRPLPPPPPPQDCYSGPDPSCTPTPAPAWLTTMPHYTSPVPRPVTLPSQIPNQRRVVSAPPTEQQLLTQLKEQTRGLTQEQEQDENGATGERSKTECDLSSLLTNIAGKPLLPQARDPRTGREQHQSGGGPSAPGCADGLTDLQKALVNGIAGAANNLVGDLAHGVRDPQTLIGDAVIGAASNIFAGVLNDVLSDVPFVSADVVGEEAASSLNETISATISGAIGNGLNSLGTQLAANNGDPSKVNMATVLIESLIGGLAGATDPLAKESGFVPGDSGKAEILRTDLAFTVSSELAVCDPGLLPQHENPC